MSSDDSPLLKIPFQTLALSLVLVLALVSGCASKSTRRSVPRLPPNIRIFQAQAAEVWNTLTSTLQYDFLLPLQVLDKKGGYFSSELVRDSQPVHTKYRVSGTLGVDEGEVVVKLYKHQQILVERKWKAIPSDLKLEMRILDAVAEKLSERRSPETEQNLR